MYSSVFDLKDIIMQIHLSHGVGSSSYNSSADSLLVQNALPKDEDSRSSFWLEAMATFYPVERGSTV